MTLTGRLALITLSSKCQVHPVIATRWSGSLKGKTLLAVMVRLRSCCRVPLRLLGVCHAHGILLTIALLINVGDARLLPCIHCLSEFKYTELP